MGPGPITTVIQVTNVAPVVTNEQLRSLFTNIGTIREFVVYPTNDPSQQVSRVCYVRFIDPMNVGVAQHLTNTVFIDRSILVQPVIDNKIPDEAMAMKLANEGHSQNSSNSGVVSQIETVNGVQSLTTIDPRLDALGLPQYPALSPSLDPAKIEEIRRTIVVSNFNRLTTPEQLLDFFNQFGEVKYLRMTMEESAMIEYTDQSSVANALQNTGITFNGCQLNIAHSSTSILKPVYKINVDPVKILNQLPAVAAAPVAKDVRRRSRSRSYRRSRSPSTRRKRSRTPPRRSRERRRSISGSRSPVIRRKRSRSKERIRSPYVSRRRSRDRSFSRERRSRRDRSRERDRNRRRSSRDRSLERIRTYERDRERDRDRDRKRRDRSREKDYDRALRERSKERIRERKRERSRSRESDRKDKHRSTRHNNKDVLIERHVRSRSRSSEIKLKLTKSPPPQAHNNNNNSNNDNDNNNNNGKNKEKESLSDINNDSNGGDLMDMDIDGLDSNSGGSIQLKKSTMIITDVAENDASLKSDEHSSSQKSLSPVPPPPEVTITTTSSKTTLIPPAESPHKSSTTSTHHRSSSSSRHKHHKHQKKIPLSRDFDSDE